MKNPIELAAQFIRRDNIVLANDVLRDEYGVEYAYPAQVQYYEFHYTGQYINEALKHVAEMFGCLTYMAREDGSTWLTVVGEKEAIDKLEEVRRVALSDEYGYKDALSKAVSGADIRSQEEYEKWSKDYVIGFFDGLIGNGNLGWFGMFSKHPHVVGILDGAQSAQRYVKEKK